MLAISQGVYYNKLHRVEICGCSSMVECQLPKLNTGVRFPSPAPKNDKFLMELVVFYVSFDEIRGVQKMPGEKPSPGIFEPYFRNTSS